MYDKYVVIRDTECTRTYVYLYKESITTATNWGFFSGSPAMFSNSCVTFEPVRRRSDSWAQSDDLRISPGFIECFALPTDGTMERGYPREMRRKLTKCGFTVSLRVGLCVFVRPSIVPGMMYSVYIILQRFLNPTPPLLIIFCIYHFPPCRSYVGLVLVGVRIFVVVCVEMRQGRESEATEAVFCL